jgi:L-malate glycosyltransferase
MIRILMIGSFLSKSTGTKGTSEKLIESLNSGKIEFQSASSKQNRILRLLDIIVKCAFANYDIIHIDTFSGMAFRITEAAIFISFLRRKRALLSLHGGRLPEFYKKHPKRVQRSLSKAYMAKTPSLYLKTFFKGQNIELQYLPNSIILSQFPYKRDSIISHSLLWVRAFSEIYNPHLPVLVLNEIRKIYPDAKLTMIGPDKGLLPQTKELIFNLGLDSSVRIVGPIKNDQLFSYYQTHEVYLNTTSYESFGMALIEAASCGIPIVSTKVGEVPFLYTHEENVLMVEKFEPIDFADQIIRIFKSSLFAESLSKNARKIAEKFDWDNIKPEWEKILQK